MVILLLNILPFTTGVLLGGTGKGCACYRVIARKIARSPWWRARAARERRPVRAGWRPYLDGASAPTQNRRRLRQDLTTPKSARRLTPAGFACLPLEPDDQLNVVP